MHAAHEAGAHQLAITQTHTDVARASCPVPAGPPPPATAPHLLPGCQQGMVRVHLGAPGLQEAAADVAAPPELLTRHGDAVKALGRAAHLQVRTPTPCGGPDGSAQQYHVAGALQGMPAEARAGDVGAGHGVRAPLVATSLLEQHCELACLLPSYATPQSTLLLPMLLRRLHAVLPCN